MVLSCITGDTAPISLPFFEFLPKEKHLFSKKNIPKGMPVPANFSLIYVKTVTFSPHLSPLIRLSFNRLSLKVTV